MRFAGRALALWSALLFSGARTPSAVDTLTITIPSSVDEIATGTNAAVYQGVPGHTLYGAAIYFDVDQYLWLTVNGIGVDPDVTGTAHELVVNGTAPFSPSVVAAAMDTLISAEGYTVARADGVLVVSHNSIDVTGAAAAQNALVSWSGRGDGGVLGILQQDNGSSTAGNSTGWIQILPDDVPSGPFRLMGFGIRRGSNVGAGVMMSVAAGSGPNGDPEDSVVQHYRTMGDSGANEWHYELLSPTEVVYFVGSEDLYVSTHGDGAASSLFGGGALNDGFFATGSTNLWLTDGTTGSTTPPVSPVGAVTSSFNFGLAVRLLIQVAPYQSAGDFRWIHGAIEGRHDGNLTAGQTPMDEIFVSWQIASPDIDDVSLVDTRARFQAHEDGDSNQVRFELFTPDGGASTMAGDLIVSTIGRSQDGQGTGWSSVQQGGPIAVTSNSTYRVSIKGEPAPGEADDTILDVWLGTQGAAVVADWGHPAGIAAGTTSIPATEREVDSATGETAIDFDPTVQTASPNPANGPVTSPNNLPMIEWHFGKIAPTVVANVA